MSQPLPAENCAAPKKRCRCRKCCLTVILLGILIVGGLHLACPLKYEATATIQIRSTKAHFLVYTNPSLGGGYDNLVNTQIAYMRSPAVLDRVLKNSDVARLPVIFKQTDRRGWLTNKLRIRREGHSEIVKISIRTNAEDASEKIVNAVVDAYFQFIEEISRQTDTAMLTQLQVEKRRQQSQAVHLQEQIRADTRKVAEQGGGTDSKNVSLEQSEVWLQEIAVAGVTLTKLRAESKAIVERVEQLNRIPLSILVQVDPEVVSLNRQKDELWRERKELRLDNPKGVEILHEIKELEDKIAAIAANADDDAVKSMRNHLLAEEGMALHVIEQKIRAQEIQVEELRQAYIAQLVISAQRSEDAVDVSFNQTQLARTNKTIDQIDDRILAIQAEARAPGQITPLSKAVTTVPRRCWLRW